MLDETKIAELEKRVAELEVIIFGGELSSFSRQQRILLKCSAHFGVTIASLIGRDRTGHIVKARHAAMYLLHKAGFNTYQIGETFRRDHGTATYAMEQIKRRLLTDRKLAEDLELLKTTLITDKN